MKVKFCCVSRKTDSDDDVIDDVPDNSTTSQLQELAEQHGIESSGLECWYKIIK